MKRNKVLYGSAAGLALAVLAAAAFAPRLIATGDLADPRYFPRQEDEFPSRHNLEAILAQSQKTLEADPGDLRALTRSGLAYFALGREHAVEAVNHLERARELGALDRRLFYYLGRLYALVGLPQFAVPEFERFLRHAPEDFEVQMELGRLYFEMEQYERSAPYYERLLKAPGSKDREPVILENLALISLKLKDWEKAKNLFLDLRTRHPDYGRETSFFMGEAYRGAGECSQALPLYEEALKAASEPGEKASVLEGKILCERDLSGHRKKKRS